MDVLTDQQCWELLEGNQLGRLAVVVAGQPDIFPVNYLLHEGQVIFKTGEGSKLASVSAHHEVAFEIDGYDESTNEAWSVVLVGMAKMLSHDAEVEKADTLPLYPWNLDPKHHYVAIDIERISGRRFVAEGRR
ncbi:MAG: pyridoxamine 5'-phosphate oxidase family protein [Candidatus Nanopelagicales bacterium]